MTNYAKQLFKEFLKTPRLIKKARGIGKYDRHSDELEKRIASWKGNPHSLAVEIYKELVDTKDENRYSKICTIDALDAHIRKIIKERAEKESLAAIIKEWAEKQKTI